MTKKAKKFDPTGDFATQIVRYLIHKAKEATGQGINASEGDYSWKSFVRDSEALALSIADNHPGGEHDHYRLARVNYNRQASKFVDWLANGRGYPKGFASRAGLIDSKLGGKEGDIKAGSDNDISDHEDESDVEEIPIADTTPKKKPAQVTPAGNKSSSKKTPSRPFNLEEISENLENLYLNSSSGDEDKEMHIITVVRTDVMVKGYAPVKYQDLLVMQALLVGGAVVSTIRVEVNRSDPNQGTVTVDQDPYVLVGARRTKKEWKSGNSKLADDLEALFDLECKDKSVEGSTPPHARIEETFCWPNDLKSQLNPVDPYVLGFRVTPSVPGQTLFDMKTIKTKTREGKVVPAMLLTAFFFVEKYTHINNTAGSGLRVELAASDSDSDGSMTPRNPNTKRRKRSSESNAAGTARASGGVGDNGGGSNTVPMDATDGSDSYARSFFARKPAPNPKDYARMPG